MKGLSSSTTNKLKELVDDFFDRMAITLLGATPNLKKKKAIVFTSKPSLTLAHIFLKSLETDKPLPTEEEALKTILSTAESYIDSLREKTKAGLLHKVDSYVKEKRMKGLAPSSVDIKKEVQKSFQEAQSHFKTIVESESTKSRNVGKLFQISKVASSQNDKDPNVFWVVTRDGKTCKHCIEAHLLPDKVTPKVWKLSEVKFSYLGKDEKGKAVSVAGQHPHCRCSISFIAKGFGFKNGQVAYIGPDHNEYRKQKGEG